MVKTGKKIIGIAGLVLAVFNLLMFFSMRPCWSGISKTFGYTNGGSKFILGFPVYLCIVFFLIFISELALVIFSKFWKRWPIIYLIVNTILLGGVIAIIVLGAKDYMRFIWVYFFKALGVAAAVGLIGWLLFAYPRRKVSYNKIFRTVGLGLAIICACLYLTGFEKNELLHDPVVYAVEDEYQIVFSSKADSLGWVTAGGKDYYDLYAGSQVSDKIHKVCVPMEVLDKAGGYEIHLQKVIYRGPFGGLLGKEITKDVEFRPVDLSDGLRYFNLSDIHMNKIAACGTEFSVGEYDFLVLDGDIVSDVETFKDANYANEVASLMTHGEMPVIYARGNHEVKGAWSDKLYRFVGSKDQKFYFSVNMGGLYALVLDIGEDHEDDWWEYYGTAAFDQYREEQLRFVDSEIEKGSYMDAKYRLIVCHIPIVYVNYRHNHEYIKKELTDRLNRMDIDMSICGHQHEVLIFEPGLVAPYEKLVYNPEYAEGTYSGYLTDFNFPNLMASKFGYIQKESESDKKSHIGLLIEADVDAKTQVCSYINSNGESIKLVNPFADKSYGNSIEISADGRWE